MRLRAPHIIGIALIGLGIAAVLVVQLLGLGRGGSDGRPSGPLTVVQGVVGSEKQAFFDDPEVQRVFADHGFDVRVTSSGSLRMASLPDLAENDFAFPASAIAAKNIEDKVDGVVGTHELFFSPMAVATFQPILDLLAENGVAEQGADDKWVIDIAAYLELVAADTRWNQLEGSEAYASPRTVLITSTDIRSSNSAAMYLSLAAYVLADNSVVTSQTQAQKLLPELGKLFLAQGYSGSSSAAPFATYLAQGMGAVPMVMIYEGQFLEELIKENSRITDEMVLAYPSPTFFSTHTGVTFSEHGEQVMRVISEDAELARLLAVHGFRATGDNQALFTEFVAEQGLEAEFASPGSFVNIAQEPSYEVLDYLLTRIGEEYDLSGAPPAPSEAEAEGSQP
ncbi:hypothetical protein J4H92_09700 [Leucobacter weissii]|uniref:Extracellular solute-binding protein n=1 Tax=Leucobacter weissii TaxID=1983706 RepID=A0A939MJQ1_9MICO|nr:hypothetical protein [Leucobacter weissii]MBO1902219.1 hypothetical protein [Leucobacter weissii]